MTELVRAVVSDSHRFAILVNIDGIKQIEVERLRAAFEYDTRTGRHYHHCGQIWAAATGIGVFRWQEARDSLQAGGSILTASRERHGNTCERVSIQLAVPEVNARCAWRTGRNPSRMRYAVSVRIRGRDRFQAILPLRAQIGRAGERETAPGQKP